MEIIEILLLGPITLLAWIVSVMALFIIPVLIWKVFKDEIKNIFKK